VDVEKEVLDSELDIDIARLLIHDDDADDALCARCLG
jgi:hypothetical protein